MRLLYCEVWFQYESHTPHSIHVSLNALIIHLSSYEK